MTIEEKCRLSYYKKIADISTHKNVCLVQHLENLQIYVRKEQMVYDKEVYEYLKFCNNPHIPQIYECIEDDGMLILIEEYVQGETVEQYLQQIPKEQRYQRVCEFMITVCDVLEQLHSLSTPVIHRDLKPDNIIIDKNGYLKIIDFNTAKQFHPKNQQDTVLIGTREYAAPEQFGYRQSDVRTDIHAIGVMINYLLIHDYPRNQVYTSGDKKEDMLTDVIRKCTAFSPEDRYQNVTELQMVLQKCLTDCSGVNKIAESRETDTPEHEKPYENDGSAHENKSGLWNLPFLPPGFRTGHIGKMLLAAMGYGFMFWVCLSMDITSEGVPVTDTFEIWANRITCLLWMLFTVFFVSNYLDMNTYFAGMKHKYWKWLGYIGYPFLILFVLVMILSIVTGF